MSTGGTLVIENHNIEGLAFQLRKCCELEILSYSLRSLLGVEEAGCVRSLKLDGWKSRQLVTLQGIQEIKASLVHLSLKSCRGLVNLDLLNSLTNLQTLELNDLEGVKPRVLRLQSLQNLSVCNCPFTAPQIYAPGDRLKSLQIGIVDATTLEGQLLPATKIEIISHKLDTLDYLDEFSPYLRQLSLVGVQNDRFQSLKGIEKLLNLKTLRLKGFKMLQSLEQLNFLTQLESVTLEKLKFQKDGEVQQQISTNARVEIIGCGPKIIQSFVYAPQMIIQRANYHDFSFLVKPIYVTHLVIQDCNGFKTMHNIGQIKNLESLKLLNCKVENMAGCEELEDQLMQLYINNCKVSSLEFLYDVSQLEILNLDDNGISDVEQLIYLRFLKHLKYISLIDNPVVGNALFMDRIYANLPQTVTSLYVNRVSNLITERFQARVHRCQASQSQNGEACMLQQLLTYKSAQNQRLRRQIATLRENYELMQNQFENTIYQLKLEIEIERNRAADGTEEGGWQQWSTENSDAASDAGRAAERAGNPGDEVGEVMKRSAPDTGGAHGP